MTPKRAENAPTPAEGLLQEHHELTRILHALEKLSGMQGEALPDTAWEDVLAKKATLIAEIERRDLTSLAARTRQYCANAAQNSDMIRQLTQASGANLALLRQIEELDVAGCQNLQTRIGALRGVMHNAGKIRHAQQAYKAMPSQPTAPRFVNGSQ